MIRLAEVHQLQPDALDFAAFALEPECTCAIVHSRLYASLRVSRHEASKHREALQMEAAPSQNSGLDINDTRTRGCHIGILIIPNDIITMLFTPLESWAVLTQGIDLRGH